MKKRLTEKQINAIVELLKEGKPLPEEYRWLLFEGKQETELIYAGKIRDGGCFNRDNGCAVAEG